MTRLRFFASDNNSGVHPRIMAALERANCGQCKSYGEDELTLEADEKLREHFGQNIDPYFVFLGTAANVLALRAVTESYNSVLCADTAHINVDECGAPENYAGCKLQTVPNANGKISAEQLKPFLHDVGVHHHNQPRVVSITQCTELGTVYTPAEIKALADFAHNNNMLLHMDGARLCNAAATLGCSFRDITADCGVDVLSFGGTKNGLMFGEAIIFFDPELSRNFRYIRKQGMQLYSKMRYIAAQFSELLTDELWLENAQRAGKMAQLLTERVRGIKGVTITRPVETNHVFATLPKEAAEKLLEEFYFYIWNPEKFEVRWMTSFDTQEQDVEDFASALERVLEG